MFDFRLDPQAKLPVFRQIVDQMHFAIATGALGPGQRVTSLRTLSARHGVAINTLVKAFKVLEQRGLVRAVARSGYRVVGAGAPDSGRRRQGTTSRYAARGVSATKKEVHGAIATLDPGLYPGAFCKITEDYLTGDPDLCSVIHADGSGTKSLLAYLHYRETGDPAVFRGIAQDSLVMNLDDLLCVGVTDRILVSTTINRNAKRIGAEVLQELILGTEAYLARLREHGVGIYSGGGETADVGDLTRTAVVDSCCCATLPKSDVIDGSGIRPGLVIVGLASSGQAHYEDRENSGIGSNGLTSARHDLLSSHYRKRYPETFDPGIDPALIYTGPYRLSDALPGSRQSVGEALLSPTRSYAPVIRALLTAERRLVKGLVHCSGGGQTKCLRFGRTVHFVKDSLLPIPPIFKAIQRASKTSWKEMYQVYNMGHRMEVYCTARDARRVIEAARDFGIMARVIGRTERASGGKNHLTVCHGSKRLTYDAP
ncbi:MAG: GntR family transcriptional regulator [Polyangiaceae bacterium]|nr:GntR family transcriptional regulator [Polyangiaceae bacterium]